MKTMAADMQHTPNWLGFIITGIGFIYARITASDLASCFTALLAIANIVIIWPKLKVRIIQIRIWLSKKNKDRHE